MHIAIVGAGIIGASFAEQLTGRGIDVTVLDKARSGAGATGKSFGWVNANAIEKPSYFSMRIKALKEWRTLCERLDLAHLCATGSLCWEGEDIEMQAEALRSAGHAVQVLTQAEIAAREPALVAPPKACLFAADELAVDPNEVAERLLRRAAAQGAVIRMGCGVDHVIYEGSQTVGVHTAFGPVYADHVVIAAGTASGGLVASAGRLPMQNGQGVLLRSLPVKPRLRHIILTPDVHFWQSPSGVITVGEIFNGGITAGTDPTVLAKDILSRLKRHLPKMPDLMLGEVLCGTRPMPCGGLPAIGPMPRKQGLYLASMHSGVTLGPLIGRLVTQELLDHSPSAALQDFRPDRFDPKGDQKE